MFAILYNTYYNKEKAIVKIYGGYNNGKQK